MKTKSYMINLSEREYIYVQYFLKFQHFILTFHSLDQICKERLMNTHFFLNNCSMKTLKKIIIIIYTKHAERKIPSTQLLQIIQCLQLSTIISNHAKVIMPSSRSYKPNLSSCSGRYTSPRLPTFM